MPPTPSVAPISYSSTAQGSLMPSSSSSSSPPKPWESPSNGQGEAGLAGSGQPIHPAPPLSHPAQQTGNGAMRSLSGGATRTMGSSIPGASGAGNNRSKSVGGGGGGEAQISISKTKRASQLGGNVPDGLENSGHGMYEQRR